MGWLFLLAHSLTIKELIRPTVFLGPGFRTCTLGASVSGHIGLSHLIDLEKKVP
jgi:hypothetical protein